MLGPGIRMQLFYSYHEGARLTNVGSGKVSYKGKNACEKEHDIYNKLKRPK